MNTNNPAANTALEKIANRCAPALKSGGRLIEDIYELATNALAAPTMQAAEPVTHTRACLSIGGGTSDDDCICANTATRPQAAGAGAAEPIAEPAHWRAVLDPEQAIHQPKMTLHVVGFHKKTAAEGWIAEQLDFKGWRYTLEPLYTRSGAIAGTPAAAPAGEAPEPFGYWSKTQGKFFCDQNSTTCHWMLNAHRRGETEVWPADAVLLYAHPQPSGAVPESPLSCLNCGGSGYESTGISGDDNSPCRRCNTTGIDPQPSGAVSDPFPHEVDNMPIDDAAQTALYAFTKGTPHYDAVRALYRQAYTAVNPTPASRAVQAAPVAPSEKWVPCEDEGCEHYGEPHDHPAATPPAVAPSKPVALNYSEFVLWAESEALDTDESHDERLQFSDRATEAAYAAAQHFHGTAAAPLLPLQGPPEGWRLVPIEPTTEMLGAILEVIKWSGGKAAYRSMLDATPTAPGAAPIKEAK